MKPLGAAKVSKGKESATKSTTQRSVIVKPNFRNGPYKKTKSLTFSGNFWNDGKSEIGKTKAAIIRKFNMKHRLDKNIILILPINCRDRR